MESHGYNCLSSKHESISLLLFSANLRVFYIIFYYLNNLKFFN